MAGTMQMGKWREKVTGKHQAPFFVCVYLRVIIQEPFGEQHCTLTQTYTSVLIPADVPGCC